MEGKEVVKTSETNIQRNRSPHSYIHLFIAYVFVYAFAFISIYVREEVHSLRQMKGRIVQKKTAMHAVCTVRTDMNPLTVFTILFRKWLKFCQSLISNIIFFVVGLATLQNKNFEFKQEHHLHMIDHVFLPRFINNFSDSLEKVETNL